MEEKDEIYAKIARQYKSPPSQNTVIETVNVSAQIGKEGYLEEVVGKHIIRNKTKNSGYKLCVLAAKRAQSNLKDTRRKQRESDRSYYDIQKKTKRYSK